MKKKDVRQRSEKKIRKMLLLEWQEEQEIDDSKEKNKLDIASETRKMTNFRLMEKFSCLFSVNIVLNV